MKTQRFLPFSIFLLMLLCSACIFTDEPFVMNQNDYFGDEIKLNGFYYSQGNYSTYNPFVVYCFYSNGVVYNANFDQDSISGIESSFKNRTYLSHTGTWGIFAVTDTILRIEFVRNYGGLKGLSHTRLGLFPNDSTISISSEIITNMDPEEDWNRKLNAENKTVFYFQPCIYKPDSSLSNL